MFALTTLDPTDSLKVLVLLKDVVNSGSALCSFDCSDFFAYAFAQSASICCIATVRCAPLLYEIVQVLTVFVVLLVLR